MAYPIGRSGFYLAATMNRAKGQIRAELYIGNEQAKAFFGLLKAQKELIEKELGYPLEWEELPTRRDSRIAIYRDGIDPDNESDWPQQHQWLAKRLNDLHRVLSVRVAALNADKWNPEGSV